MTSLSASLSFMASSVCNRLVADADAFCRNVLTSDSDSIVAVSSAFFFNRVSSSSAAASMTASESE